MTEVKGLTADSPFIELFGDLPVSTVLKYVHDSWLSYVDFYKESSPAFQDRTEPQLTQALAAHLRSNQDLGKQPFIGDFFGELPDYIIDIATGLPKCIARTDIEWRLYGVPGFIIEFKILDGKKQRREKYLIDGVMRFVTGRYSSSTNTGAMFALMRKKASKDPNLLMIELEKGGAKLQCADVRKASQLLPTVAAFDSAHLRSAPHITPFVLAHLFIPLP